MVRCLLGLFAILIAPALVRADITTNLQVRYRLDETSGNAIDSSGNGRDGTRVNGAAFTTSGRLGGAVEFDGSNDYIDCPAIGATDGTSALTVAFWVKADVLASGNYEIYCAKLTSANYMFSVQNSASGPGGADDLEVVIDNGSSYHGVYTSSNVLSTNTWIHVAVVYDGSQSTNVDRCKIYVNGQLVGRTLFGSAIPTTLHSDATAHWTIGWRLDSRP